MRIGEVAAAAGVSTRALRYYEERDLLSAERSHSGQRHYTEGAVERVRLIQQLYAAGLTSRVIAELLPCVHTGFATPAQLALLAAERDRIDRQAAELVEARDRLDAVIVVAEATRSSSGAGVTVPGPCDALRTGSGAGEGAVQVVGGERGGRGGAVRARPQAVDDQDRVPPCDLLPGPLG